MRLIKIFVQQNFNKKQELNKSICFYHIKTFEFNLVKSGFFLSNYYVFIHHLNVIVK